MKEKFNEKSPKIGQDVYIAPDAIVIGDVELGNGVSIWHGAVVRGDVWNIRIGEYSNIQDNCVCHVTTAGPELTVCRYVTVGHGAILHSCKIGDGCLIGMNAVILDGVKVGEGSIVAAGSVLLEGMQVPSHSLVTGVPAKVKRELAINKVEDLFDQAKHYHELALTYLSRGDLHTR